MSHIIFVKLPFGIWMTVKSLECRKLKRGDVGVPTYVYERCEVHLCLFLPMSLQLCRCYTAWMDAFEFQRKCGLGFVPR